ncbi:exosome complex component RRP4 homolog [Vicia villosa]|uniref:exosome complex component RRP4 homolog n=1 Tax=Vicia villosa TaxID=3911 RepID=UPI00273BC5B7|nr:exosome complex component RRP4 homolog [Vicia villosa]
MEIEMRGIQLQFNQIQKLRLNKAMKSLSSNVNFDDTVTIADSISVNREEGVLKGHGTSDLDGEIVSTLCGTVQRVNKLVYVRPLSSRYKPEVGDIVIGRVVEVAQKHWKLDINCSQNACLMLSAMNMLDGVQRRKTAKDELNMRCIFEESDYICVEVRDFTHCDIHLQTRSQKHGKLSSGQLLTVSPYLVKRQKQHFHHLEQYGIDLIIGCNGFIWVGEHDEARDDMVEEQVNQFDPQVLVSNKSSASFEEQERSYTSLETRKYICRAANAVRVLSTLGFIITVEIINGVIDLSVLANTDIIDMLGSEFCVMVAEKEAERRNSD